jgi:hypothetical protein
LTRCVEAIYTDVLGREVFRELLVDGGCGAPTAVQHRDGCTYLLIAETGRRAVYRKAADPAPRCVQRHGSTVPALQGYWVN